MAFRHEVLHIRRQKQRLIDIPAAKILAHRPRLNQTRSELNSRYSDGLLDTRGSSDDGPWACNGFTASTVPATGLRALGFCSARLHSGSSPRALCCDRARFSPSVSCAVDPDPMQDHCKLTCQGNFCALRASPLGDVHPPALKF